MSANTTTKTRAIYETSDLDLSATLSACGIQLLNLYRNGDGRTVFVFDDTDGRCDELKREYVTGMLRLPASELLRRLRELKWKLHNID